jgi:hypothetical protein
MSVKVIVIKDPPIDQIVINSEVTTIGRKSECDISIKDSAVSGTCSDSGGIWPLSDPGYG